MKYLFAAVLALGTVASFGAAEAAQGCGPGWARGPYGRCQPIRRAVVVRPAAPVVVVRPPARTVVVRPGRVCPYGTVWRYGRCRAY
ncbi:hypothetical protein [Bradyrhizobium sp. LMTR 3]|uniref:GCG_CRPN prefix-to-repeats domain-containing protein n=1 Tax=Bradyrhizobium sp. LMTR 3 TaxID=189873 RepID=UPI000A035173|nr:hypothetical protein [Bradyrhizobium sp. LMTR 3]